MTAQSSKRVRICGHLVVFKKNASNMNEIIFKNGTYWSEISSYLSLKENLVLQRISTNHNSFYKDIKHLNLYHLWISPDFGKQNTPGLLEI